MPSLNTKQQNAAPTTRKQADWLAYLETLHPKRMDLTLDRVRAVGERLRVLSFRCPVVVVGGTNGKGSTASALAAVAHEAGLRVGLFLSPHLLSYNERIQYLAQPVREADLVAAFETTDNARQDTTLTYFEMTFLAAAVLFHKEDPDLLIWEVGLGGRLDAVNVLEPTHAVISSLGLDHTQILGDTVEAIGQEKAGIFRPPPQRIFVGHSVNLPCMHAAAHALGNTLQVVPEGEAPPSHVPQQSAALVRAVAQELCASHFPQLTDAHVAQVLAKYRMPGRWEVVQGAFEVIMDVAHNPPSSLWLSQQLRRHPCQGRTWALWGGFADKNLEGISQPLLSEVHQWCVATVPGTRAASAAHLAHGLKERGAAVQGLFQSPEEAFVSLTHCLSPQDRLLIFGGFSVVASVHRLVHQWAEAFRCFHNAHRKET